MQILACGRLRGLLDTSWGVEYITAAHPLGPFAGV
jgi:hypothetical protein